MGNDTNARIKGEEDQKAAINAQAAKVTADANKLRDDIKVLEGTMEACEEDKATKDGQIRTLKDEIAHQEELVAKLTKKREILETLARRQKKTFNPARINAIT